MTPLRPGRGTAAHAPPRISVNALSGSRPSTGRYLRGLPRMAAAPERASNPDEAALDDPTCFDGCNVHDDALDILARDVQLDPITAGDLHRDRTSLHLVSSSDYMQPELDATNSYLKR
jgi:hypothetical protein